MKRGYLQISFSFIFSLFLIIIFVSVAFYAIKTFINLSNSAKLGKAISKLESDVDLVWKSSQSSDEFSYDVPKKIKYFCFANMNSSPRGGMSSIYPDLQLYSSSGENTFFYPFEIPEFRSYKLEHIDIEKITSRENPYCIENKDEKIKLRLEKKFSESLVTVKR